MGIISKPYTFSPNTTASSSEVNSDFDTIYNELNGAIAAANLATDAVTTAKIADSNVTTAKIADSNVTTAKIADSGVTAAKLSTSAILLGYAQITGDFSTTNSSATLVTGLSASVTIPSGGRKVKITCVADLSNGTATINTSLTIWDGTVGSGTQLALGSYFTPQGSTGNAAGRQSVTAVAVVTPSAGAKTYNIGLHQSGASTAILRASATAPAFILVEAV